MNEEERQTSEEERIERAKILLALMRFRMESHMLNMNAQHCKTPGCCGIFNTTRNEKEDDKLLGPGRRGFELELCSCGATACMKCKKKAHVGLSCLKYSKIVSDIESGKSFAEAMRSVQLYFFLFPIFQLSELNHLHFRTAMIG